ncbi:MAG: radical SAM protein [Myxococcota bacterium]
MSKRQAMLEREAIANRKKHWVRAVTACNSRCVFCLDMDTPRNVFLPVEEIQAELRRGRQELDADKVIISGGEASLHPQFPALIEYARAIGYDRVQTVTNGWNFADRAFYKTCMKAGLGEITFSLHGHTPELHDRLTRHHGAFRRLMKGLIRAVRDPRGPIVNIDVVINKQNVGVLDRIIELGASVGVYEYDLLHVIPQAEAFREREQLFYDVRDHMGVLHKVFRLNRHPRFVIWTNRFPVSYLEGLEDLIQDPHKMLDEVNGRRYQVRQYLDTGKPLDCRQPERCIHCFIEPFCTTTDRVIARQRDDAFEVWQSDDLNDTLPYGCTTRGLAVGQWDQLPGGQPLEVVGMAATPIPADVPTPLRLIAESPEQLDAWLPTMRAGVTVEIRLSAQTAAWMLGHRDLLAVRIDQVRVHQPSHEHMADAVDHDVRDPAAFFRALDLRLQVSGLPACLAPNTRLVPPIARLAPTLFDMETGRIHIRALSHHHIAHGYRAKSERCRDCAVNDRCDGIHINMIRDQGLSIAQPLQDSAWAEDAAAQLQALWPTPPTRVRDGQAPLRPADSLPGFPPPAPPPKDPLAVLAVKLEERRAARRAARKKMLAEAKANAEAHDG